MSSRASSTRFRGVDEVRVLGYSSDSSRNQWVLTLAGKAEPLKDAVLTLYERAVAAIDLRSPPARHPRLGAVDVW